MTAAHDMARVVIAEVCEETGIGERDILGESKMHHIAHARQRVMFRLRSYGMPLSLIGRLLQRDHTTVLYGIRAEQKRQVAAHV